MSEREWVEAPPSAWRCQTVSQDRQIRCGLPGGHAGAHYFASGYFRPIPDRAMSERCPDPLCKDGVVSVRGELRECEHSFHDPSPEADKGACVLCGEPKPCSCGANAVPEADKGAGNGESHDPQSEFPTPVSADAANAQRQVTELRSQLQEAREALRNCLADLEQAVAWLHPEEAGSFNLYRHREALTDTEETER